MKTWIRCLLAMLLALALPGAWAHKPSDSYLSLEQQGDTLRGRWDIALRDLDYAIGLDAAGNGELTWDQVRSKHKDIAAYALARLTIQRGGAVCQLRAGAQMLDQHSDGTYTVLPFQAHCRGDGPLTLRYGLLFDLDPQHKGLLKLTQTDGSVITAIFSPEHPVQSFASAGPSRARQAMDYVAHGVWHIWIGYDHILFLLSLLLPAVFVQNGRDWRAGDSLRAAALDVLKVVSAFTLAHSITLSLAALHLVSLPSRWVESAIALSVALAALNNLVPLFHRRRWWAAFGFGLVHGFGFASVLGDLGLPPQALLLALFSFNLGVELGQLAIVAAFLPLAYLARRSWAYRRIVFDAGSAAVVLIACVWLAERSLEVKLI